MENKVQSGRSGRRPLWYHGWNVVAVTILLQSVTFGIGLYCFTFWIEPFRVEFGQSAGAVLSVVTALSIAKGLIGPVLGGVMDRRPARPLVVLGVATFGAGMLLTAAATSFWQIFVIYTLLLPVGLVFAGIQGAQTLTARWFTERRGLALGVSALGTSIGGLAFPPVVTHLMSIHGWRTTNVIIAVTFLAVMVPLVLLVLREPQDAAALRAGSNTPKGEEANTVPGRTWATGQILSSRNYIVLAFAFFLMNFVFSSIQFNIAPLAKDVSVEPRMAAYLVSSMALAMLPAKIVVGALSDKVDNRLLFWIICLIMGASVLCGQQASGFVMLLACTSLLGLAVGGLMPILSALIAANFDRPVFGRVLGFVMLAVLFASTGPTFAGWARSVTGDFDVIFYMSGAAILLAAGSMFFIGNAGQGGKRVPKQTFVPGPVLKAR